MYIAFRRSVQFAGRWVLYIFCKIYVTAILCVHHNILPVSTKHVKIYKLLKLQLSLYIVAAPFALYKCSIHLYV